MKNTQKQHFIRCKIHLKQSEIRKMQRIVFSFLDKWEILILSNYINNCFFLHEFNQRNK